MCVAATGDERVMQHSKYKASSWNQAANPNGESPNRVDAPGWRQGLEAEAPDNGTPYLERVLGL